MVSTPNDHRYRGKHDPYNNMEEASIRPENIAKQKLSEAEQSASKKQNVSSLDSVSSRTTTRRGASAISDATTAAKASERNQTSDNFRNSVQGRRQQGKQRGFFKRMAPIAIVASLVLGGGAFFYGAQSMLGPHLSAMYTNATDVQFSSYNFGVDFQHLFGGNAEKNLTFSYKMWGNNSNNNSLSLNPEVHSDNNYGVDYTGRKTDNKTTSAEHTFQIDYSAPVSSILTVETGGKYIFRPKKSDGFTYLNNGGILSLLDDQTVKTTNNDNIGALYAQVSAKLSSKLSIRGGIRYEYTKQNVEYKNNHDRDFSIDYNTFVPSATLNYSISMMQNLSFTYNLRISRPGERQLNPYHDYSSVTAVSFGNPALDVQKYHNFGVSYGYFSLKQNINLSLRYNTCDNGITNWSFYPDAIDQATKTAFSVRDEDKDLMHNTYTNGTKTHTFSGNVYYSIQLGRSIRFFTNSTITYSEMKNPISQTANDGWSKGMNMGMFSLERSFLNDKLTFSFSAMLDFKNGTKMVMESETKGIGYTTNSKMTNYMGRFGISISYRFGKQIQVKRARNTIQNDDFERTEQTGDDTPSMSQGSGAMGGMRR